MKHVHIHAETSRTHALLHLNTQKIQNDSVFVKPSTDLSRKEREKFGA